MTNEIVESINRIIDSSENGKGLSVAECEAFLNAVPGFTDKHTIEDTRKFLDYLGNPDENMKIIHVAGTNGKGSVCSYLTSILMKAGYKVGTFVSPHLVKINERFLVDGKMISDSLFVEIFVELLQRIREYSNDGYFPTYFEFLFFMAMILYDVYPVDYLILETGLGGRLDATNAIGKPEINIITEIGFDHMQYLGNTIEDIAAEKAGIIRENVPTVFFDKQKESTDVIKKKALELDSRVVTVKKNDISDVREECDETGNKFIAFSYNSLYDKYAGLKLSTRARYQTENAAIAVASAEILRNSGAVISGEDIELGLVSAKWEGRMEEIRPGIYVDGAHNIDGIEAFLDSVAHVSAEGRKLLLFGIVADKQYEDIIEKILLSEQFDSVFVATLKTTRSVSVSDLKSTFEKCKENNGIFGVPIKYYTNVRDAVTDVITVRKSGDIVFSVGSLYLTGEIKAMM
ncbi:MAG: bifunctional folylpolyglutamate synthase/dihydrofolate synthase [Butyrivibrio sp.]|uniref:bifunctional folylpolyglutamate synthase/dihydrofolate synthase n=1 Tax=Butyrivibrio sp. TaxID=28121 RepID=UPI001B2CB1F6|nr:folylpolyglutamate synthase/dihydrofolate synthase family protein [Butyrivibrio sp.]MBO6240477.1 bifunctional folylpolyglutamate synthase/dihydrofolate synthase [Butyrivibrio sp.]